MAGPPYPMPDYEPQRKLLMDFSGGFNAGVPPSKISDSQFSGLLNMMWYQGLFQIDKGYAPYNQGYPILGSPLAVFESEESEGAEYRYLITTTTVYWDDQNAKQWKYVGNGTPYSTTAQANAGATTFTLASVTGLAVGNHIGIELNTDEELQTTITNIAGNVITTHDAVPAGASAVSGAQISVSPTLHGSTAQLVQGIAWPYNSWFIFTNGVDPPQKIIATSTVTALGGSPPICTTICEKNGFLLLGNTNEGGVQYQYRVRNSDAGNPEAWNSGLAGYVDLADTADTILNMLPLGPWVIIYREQNVMRRTYYGNPLQLWYDEYVLRNVLILSPQCVCVAGGPHFIVSETGLFLYTGGYDKQDVGQNVFLWLMGPKGTLSSQLKSLTFTYFAAQLNEVWIAYPSTISKGYCDRVLRYNTVTKSWWPFQYSDSVIAFGVSDFKQGLLWEAATNVSWNQMTQTWTQLSKIITFPVIIWCDPVNNVTWVYDYATALDEGTLNKTWTIQTKDFESPPKWVTFDGLYAKGVGQDISVTISPDRGKTWLPLGTLNMGTPWFANGQVNGQVTSPSFRLSLSGTYSGVGLLAFDWMRIDYFEATPW